MNAADYNQILINVGRSTLEAVHSLPTPDGDPSDDWYRELGMLVLFQTFPRRWAAGMNDAGSVKDAVGSSVEDCGDVNTELGSELVCELEPGHAGPHCQRKRQATTGGDRVLWP